MFGTYRTFLALAVFTAHLLVVVGIGGYAVHGFFILSGYLMTHIMTNVYGHTLSGIKSFAVNRFLRLYPPYWAAAVATLLIISLLGEEQSFSYHGRIYIPKNWQEWTQNVTLIFANIIPAREKPRLLPPTWALTVELLFYVLIGLGLSRTRRLAVLWFVVSLLYVAATYPLDLGYHHRQNSLFAGSLPFALGACIYHFRERLCSLGKVFAKPIPIVMLFLCFLINAIFAMVANKYNYHAFLIHFSFYLNYVIHALILIALMKGHLPFITKELDQRIGEFSYPIYLFHMSAGFVSSMVLWGVPVRGFNAKGIAAYFLAIIVCLMGAWAIVTFIDRPIQKLRTRVKQHIQKS